MISPYLFFLKQNLVGTSVVLGILILSSFNIHDLFSKERTTIETQISFKELAIEEALELGEKQDKLIFVSFYTNWCASCRMMRNDVFADQAIANFFNSNYLSLYLNGEKGEGQNLIKKFGIQSYPSHAFLKTDGELIGIYEGVLMPNKFVELRQSAKERGLK